MLDRSAETVKDHVRQDSELRQLDRGPGLAIAPCCIRSLAVETHMGVS